MEEATAEQATTVGIQQEGLRHQEAITAITAAGIPLVEEAAEATHAATGE